MVIVITADPTILETTGMAYLGDMAAENVDPAHVRVSAGGEEGPACVGTCE